MEFQSRGVYALVQLHEHEMRTLYRLWLEAKKREVELPKTDDADYQSLDHLFRHPLRAARGYLRWMCEQLGRPDPGIPPAPEAAEIPEEAEGYMEAVLAAWRKHLAWMTDEVAGSETTYKALWGAPYTIESMLEHAVVHPMRHRYQLARLMTRECHGEDEQKP
jgi:uncharacterized damage-inducible protein DinB